MLEPNHAQDRIDEALSVLRALGLPREQQNERSALTLLAVLDLSPTDPWEEASAPLIGVTPIMEWVETNYGRTYAPNTRETFRRFTLHQFVDAGLVVPNPDQPDRPVNSPRYCYQIEPEAHELLRTFGTGQWETMLARYLERRPEACTDQREADVITQDPPQHVQDRVRVRNRVPGPKKLLSILRRCRVVSRCADAEHPPVRDRTPTLHRDPAPCRWSSP